MNPLPQNKGGFSESRRKKNPEQVAEAMGADFGGLGTRIKQGISPGDGVKSGFEPARVDGVINNGLPDADGVINSKISRIPPGFARWAADFVALQRERLRIRGEAGAALDRWWAGLPEALRLFLLHLADPGDWTRYECTPWRGLPGPMRDAILLEARAIARACRGVLWQ